MGFRAGTLCYVVLAALALALFQIPCPEGKVTVQDPQPKAQTPKNRTLLDYFSVPTHRPGWGSPRVIVPFCTLKRQYHPRWQNPKKM